MAECLAKGFFASIFWSIPTLLGRILYWNHHLPTSAVSRSSAILGHQPAKMKHLPTTLSLKRHKKKEKRKRNLVPGRLELSTFALLKC
ncbi:hypothetical protein GE09DRAFT_1100404 [Coniochaeta sp. 2T2.1]|nr:hypothetical protein GE09DRAFT_1100404 [Coniochaeta sp. 2T2.1]